MSLKKQFPSFYTWIRNLLDEIEYAVLRNFTKPDNKGQYLVVYNIRDCLRTYKIGIRLLNQILEKLNLLALLYESIMINWEIEQEKNSS